MRVTVNYDLCCGHGFCVTAAPEVFELRDDDKAYVICEHPEEQLRGKVVEAVRSCPQMAIDLYET
jgi:ferredoxin